MAEAYQTATQMRRISDFAAALSLDRVATATCSRPETMSNCVVVCGYNPRMATFKDKKGVEEQVRVQDVDVWFGMSASGYKPDALYWNTVSADQLSFYITGKVLNGEWFCEGGRLPGGDHRESLPLQLTSRGDGEAFQLFDREVEEPKLPGLLEANDDTDGCAAQYVCGRNQHVTASVLRKGFQ